MQQPDDRFPVRKSPRIKHYDYATPNYYFVTICTSSKACLFGSPQRLNHRGKIAQSGLLEIAKHFHGVYIDKSVVMPNHIHAIIVLQNEVANLSTIIGQYKSFVTKKLHETEPNLQVWQTFFHDHVIRNEKSYQKIWNYIETNPIKWQEDCFFANNTEAGR